MHQPGHYGVAMAAYSPLAAWLLRSGDGAAALVGGAVVVSLAMLPDVDHKVPFVEHRGSTHTLLFALLAGLAVGFAAFTLAPLFGGYDPTALAQFGFVLGALAVVSHLLADVITPAGIRPFWPLAKNHYSLRLVYADNALANYVLFAAGALVCGGVVLAAGV